MGTYGYIRKEIPVATMVQIEAFIPYHCDELFVETAISGESHELESLLKILDRGDTLVVYHTSAFERTLQNYNRMIEGFKEKQITLISIDEGIDTSKQGDYYNMVKILAEMEHTVVQKKTIRGIQVAREDGRIGGRPKIDESTKERIYKLKKTRNLSLRQIAELCDVSLGTVHKYLRSKEFEEKYK